MRQRLVGDDPFAVLLADDLMIGTPPVLKQMVEQFDEWRASILAVQEVPAEHTRRYGIVAGTSVSDRMMDVTRIVEKPAPEDAPSRLGVAGRYILTPRVFDEIAQASRAASAARSSSPTASPACCAARRCSPTATRASATTAAARKGFLQANVELALQHPEVGGTGESQVARTERRRRLRRARGRGGGRPAGLSAAAASG